MKLNDKQKKAIVHDKGPVLIIAGAGTGKTTVIANRLKHLALKNKPEEILGLTFTEKTAEEMAERVEMPELWISTFHSFCDRILREHGLDIGLSDFRVLEETGSWLLIRRNIDKLKLDYYAPLGNPKKFITSLISHFSRCKDQMIDPETYLKYSLKAKEDKKRIQEIAKAYQKYQELLLENNYLDFGDLINYCLKLFKKRPLILKKYQKQFKYILVDEFQDTNYAQYELINLLAKPQNNLMVCSDDDQAIYRWRGASFGNIIQFRKDYPKALQIVLDKNYRSYQNILDLSYRFIQHNNPNRLEHISGISKKLNAYKKGKAEIKHLHFKTIETEFNGVIEKIIEIMKQEKASFSDFAVLARANNEANLFAKACERAGLPSQFMALRGLYFRPVILDIISYFKLLDNYHESSAAYRILNLPFLDIPFYDISQIAQYSYQKQKSFYEVLSNISLVKGLSSKTIISIEKIISLIEKDSILAKRKNVSEILISFLENSGYFKYLEKKGSKEDFNYINQFYNRIKRFENSSIDPLLVNFMEELNLELESGEAGKLEFNALETDAVKIMTVHAAKGLEFKHVFIINLVDRKFPSTERKESIEIPKELIKEKITEGDFHLEEERRIFYVAMTRAQNSLFFTSAQDYGGSQKKKLSRFLIEMGFGDSLAQEPLIKKRVIKTPNKELALPKHFSYTQLAAFDYCPLQYKFNHILKIPRAEKPSINFGKIIHNTIYKITLLMLEKSHSLKQALEIYNLNWNSDWFENKSQKDKYHNLGKRIVKNFYNDFVKNNPQIFYFSTQPGLEKEFIFQIENYKIKGKIDRIDKINEGIEIIDYKTGSELNDKRDKLKPEEKKQLIIYSLALEKYGLSCSKLTCYYLAEGKRLSFMSSDKDREKAKKEILSSIGKIKKSSFSARPGWHCRWCDFQTICEYRQ